MDSGATRAPGEVVLSAAWVDGWDAFGVTIICGDVYNIRIFGLVTMGKCYKSKLQTYQLKT